MLAATGTGIMIGGTHIGLGQAASVGIGMILIGVAAVVAFRRSRTPKGE